MAIRVPGVRAAGRALADVSRPRSVGAYVSAALAAGAAVAVRIALDDLLDQRGRFIIHLTAVAIVSAVLGPGPAIAAALVALILVFAFVLPMVANAAKYSADGEIRITAEGHGAMVRIGVLDRGPGIEPGEEEAIFGLFYRAPRTAAATSGLGIGLFVSRLLVEAMGGRVAAAARPGGGPAFTIELPGYDEALEDDLSRAS